MVTVPLRESKFAFSGTYKQSISLLNQRCGPRYQRKVADESAGGEIPRTDRIGSQDRGNGRDDRVPSLPFGSAIAAGNPFYRYTLCGRGRHRGTQTAVHFVVTTNIRTILVDELASKGHVAFSFSIDATLTSVLVVSVRECLEHDFAEYGEEYRQSEMFEIGPAKSLDGALVMQLVFPDVLAAGNAVLKRRESC